MKHYEKKKASKLKNFIITISILIIVCIALTFGYFALSKNTDISVTLGVGQEYHINAENPDDIKIKIQDKNIISICDDNVLTPLKEGKTEIIVRHNIFKSETLNITVIPAPDKISIESHIFITTGESYTIDAMCLSKGHKFPLTFSSSDTTIAEIDESGTVKAKSIGDCTITATTYNGISATCNVTVGKLPESFELIALDNYSKDTSVNIIIDTEEHIDKKHIKTTVSDSNVLWVDNENPLLLYAAQEGESTVTVTLSNGASATKTITVTDHISASIDGFNILNQFPALPTGCEVVSLTSVLNFYGIDVSMTTMADEYMPRSTDSYWNIDPDEYFIGTPYTWDGFGCYPGTIVKTAKNYFEKNNLDNYEVVNISGCSTEDIFNYIANGVPVITWGTSNFATPQWDAYWDVNGKKVNWCNYEHCLVTVGFDKTAGTVTLADDSGGYLWDVSLNQFKTVFDGMDNMAVVVLKK